jgi:hypothetical protein
MTFFVLFNLLFANLQQKARAHTILALKEIEMDETCWSPGVICSRGPLPDAE